MQNLFNGDGCIGGGQGQGPQPEQGGITSIQQAPQMATGCFSPFYESLNWYFLFYQGVIRFHVACASKIRIKFQWLGQ